MTPASSHTATAVQPAEPSPSSGLRLRLDSGLGRTGVVDGGWWPHSWDPDSELPELIAGLESSLGPITRVALNLDAWDRERAQEERRSLMTDLRCFDLRDPQMLSPSDAY